MSEIFQICPNLFKHVQSYLNLSKLVQTYLKLVQIGSNDKRNSIHQQTRLRRKQKSEMWKSSIVAKLNLKTLLELQIMHGGRHWNSFMFWYFIRATCIQQHDFSNEKYSCSSLKKITCEKNRQNKAYDKKRPRV